MKWQLHGDNDIGDGRGEGVTTEHEQTTTSTASDAFHTSHFSTKVKARVDDRKTVTTNDVSLLSTKVKAPNSDDDNNEKTKTDDTLLFSATKVNANRDDGTNKTRKTDVVKTCDNGVGGDNDVHDERWWNASAVALGGAAMTRGEQV